MWTMTSTSCWSKKAAVSRAVWGGALSWTYTKLRPNTPVAHGNIWFLRIWMYRCRECAVGWTTSYDTSFYESGIAVEPMPNCPSKVTVLEWLALNFQAFAAHPSTSKAAFTDYLRMQKMLYGGTAENLPNNYHEGPRLSRLYGDVALAQLIQSHNVTACSDTMWDIHDSPVWKEHYSHRGYFLGDTAEISMSLGLDGVNPFHNSGEMYSMTRLWWQY